jgi:hypothetical protein
MLVRSLTKDFTSDYAKKLFWVACTFGVAFAGNSSRRLLPVLDWVLCACGCRCFLLFAADTGFSVFPVSRD